MVAKQKAEQGTDWMYKEAFKSITNDQKVISLILLQNDGDKEMESHSQLMSTWKKIQGVSKQSTVTRYLRVLTGANKDNESMGMS